MKKKVYSILICFMMLFLTACNKKEKTIVDSSVENVEIKESKSEVLEEVVKETNLVMDFIDENYTKLSKLETNNKKGTSTELNIDVVLSDYILGLLGIDSFDTISFDTNSKVKDNNYELDLGLKIDKDEIINAIIKGDLENIYFNIPDYNENFAKIDLGEIMEEEFDTEQVSFDIDEFKKISTNYLDRIYKIIIPNMRFDKNVMIGNAAYNFVGTKYEVSINAKDLVEIIKDFEQELSEHESFKDLMFDMNITINDEDIEELGDTNILIDYYVGKNKEFAISFRIDGQGESITFINISKGFCLYITDENYNAITIAYSDIVVKGNKKEGTITIIDEDSNKYVIDYSCVNTEHTFYYENEDEDAFIKLTIDNGSKKVLNLDFSYDDLFMKLESNCENNKSYFKFVLDINDENLGYIEVNCSEDVFDEDISFPNKSVDIETWANDIDFNKIIEDIEELQEKYPEVFENILEGLTTTEDNYDEDFGGYDDDYFYSYDDEEDYEIIYENPWDDGGYVITN